MFYLKLYCNQGVFQKIITGQKITKRYKIVILIVGKRKKFCLPNIFKRYFNVIRLICNGEVLF